MSSSSPSVAASLTTRLLGVGVTAGIAVATIVLAATGSLALYINPDGAWFAVAMAVLALIGCAASFAIPLGREAEHDHDHPETHTTPLRRFVGTAAGTVGGTIAVAVVAAALFLAPASLSAQTAMDRDLGVTPLFGGGDVVALATTGDTATFGVGDWASVFATAPDSRLYEGTAVTLTGFVTPSKADGAPQLTRLVVTHCVIDAQPASIALVEMANSPQTGQWVSIDGVVEANANGDLVVRTTTVTAIDEPADPYEY